LRYQIVSLMGFVAIKRYIGQTGHFVRKFDFHDSATVVTLESYGRVHVLNLLNLVLICVHQHRVGRGRVRPGGGITGPRRLLSGVPLDCALDGMRFNRARPAWLLRIQDELLSYKLSAYFSVNKEYLRC
jgi:hypothetical protein